MLKRCIVVVAVFAATSAMAAEGAESASKTLERAGIEFVSVPGGCYPMGTSNGNSDEKPVHEVCVSSFLMGKYEITQGQWLEVMGENPSRFNKCGKNCPVEQVSWNDIQVFIRKLNDRTGKNYRLATEAEWEYACTSGGKEQKYCGGDDVNGLGWYNMGKTQPVGLKKPNGLGIHDMSGNVWEWVLDWKGGYMSGPQHDPTGPPWGSTRTRRGGSWQYGDRQARSGWRSSGYPDDHALDLGFRLVLPSAR